MNYFSKIIAIAAIALLGVGCAKMPAANQNANVALPGTTRDNPARDEMNVKILDDNSFEPTSAFVLPGTKINFINSSKTEHNLAPDVDVKTPGLSDFGMLSLAPGATASHTFTQPGRWFYYDKLHPSFSGVVEVLETPKENSNENDNANK